MQIGQSPLRYLTVGNQEDLDLTTPHLSRLCDENDTTAKGWLKPFVDRLAGQVLLDLGAGLNPSGFKVACAGGARAYIAVEKYFASYLEQGLIPLLEQNPNTSCQVVDLDMLDYLRVLPSRSVSIVTAGIDDCIIRSELKRQAIAREILRVLHPDGALLAYHSMVTPEGLELIKSVETMELRIYRLKSDEKAEITN